MGLVGWFKQLLAAGFAPAPDSLLITVKCSRCGELVSTRIFLSRDLSIDYEGGGYFCRKTLTGSNLCFNKIQVDLRFNSGRRLIGSDVSGGEFAEQSDA